jgi:hypothetical protein
MYFDNSKLVALIISDLYFMIFTNLTINNTNGLTSEDVIKYRCYFNLTLQRTIAKLGSCTKSSYHVCAPNNHLHSKI